MNSHQCRIALFYGFFEIGAESRQRFRVVELCLRTTAPELHPKSANVIALAAITMIETRQINVLAADAAVVVYLSAHQFRHEAIHVKTDLLAKVTPDGVRRISDTVRVDGGRGIEKD